MCICLLAALASRLRLRSAARAQVLAPGIGYEKQLEFTRHGPIVLHVLTAPRPGGLYTLEPVLSNGVIPGRETISADAAAPVADYDRRRDQRRLRDADGVPNGTFLQDGVYKSAPNPGRSSIGIDALGNLVVQRLALLSTWQGSNQRRALVGINRPPGPNGVTIFTPAWGGVTPSSTGTIESIVVPFPALTPGVELRGQVVQVNSSGGGTPIPANGAVLVGRGGMAARLAQEAGPGVNVNVRLIPHPAWPGVQDADRRRPAARAQRPAAVPGGGGVLHRGALAPRAARGRRAAKGREHRHGGRRRRPGRATASA